MNSDLIIPDQTNKFSASFWSFFLGGLSPIAKVGAPRWGVCAAAQGELHASRGNTVRVGIECCRLVAGIDAPRVFLALGGGPAERASVPV